MFSPANISMSMVQLAGYAVVTFKTSYSYIDIAIATQLYVDNRSTWFHLPTCQLASQLCNLKRSLCLQLYPAIDSCRLALKLCDNYILYIYRCRCLKLICSYCMIMSFNMELISCLAIYSFMQITIVRYKYLHTLTCMHIQLLYLAT